MAAKTDTAPEAPEAPGRDCPLCPRLVAMRRDLRQAHPDWHNAPVPSFGPLDARLVIVGLAPGLKGANRTGRPFTGDYAGDLLYPTLAKFGFAGGRFVAGRDDKAWTPDTLKLIDARIVNGVRCVPPANKPLPAEIRACRTFLTAELGAMKRATVALALGRIAHDTTLAAFDLRLRDYPFGHGALHRLPSGLHLADSYHCSRYNTNTRRLTTEMFESVVANARQLIDAS